MSSGPAISISENNIGEFPNNPMAHLGNDGFENKNGDITHTKNEAELADHYKCAPKSIEGCCMNPLEDNEIMNSASNHVLQPAKIENMKLSPSKELFLPKLPGKPGTYMKNCVENSATTIGASGDGLSHGSKFILPKAQKKMVVPLQNCSNSTSDENCSGVYPNGDGHTERSNPLPSPARVNVQTYAGIAQKHSTPVSKTAYVQSAMIDEGIKPKATTKLLTHGSSHEQNAVTLHDVKARVDEKSEGAITESRTEGSPDIQDQIVEDPGILLNKAIKETVGHVHGKSFDDSGDGQPDGEKLAQADSDALSNSLSEKIAEFEHQHDANVANMEPECASSNSKPSATTPRREPEKPPRMQKQRSQDRLLLLKQQKPSFDPDAKRENLSREASFECVDSTGVDVHEFLITTLRNSARDRVILLKLEHDMISFVGDKTIDFMKFPPMTSYHRMLVHRVAAYFGMDHNVDETGKCVIINKTSSTRLPDARFAEHFDPRQVDQPTGRRDDDMRRRSILKRTNQSRSFDRDDQKGRSIWKDNRQRSIEEREEEYEKIRARIFNNQEGNMQSPIYGRRGMSSMAAAKIASWSDRPWNSTDMESVPSTVRMQIPRPLTTRASSYSSISLLPRHNSATSIKTGSSSSISSMSGGNNGLQTYTQNRQNLGNRPPTPVRRGMGSNMGDSSNGTFYYMQQQNQEFGFDAVEDDIMESWFKIPESPGPQCTYDNRTVVPTDAPILLAVPSGITLPPETVLCHPVTGMPYLSPDGYQLVYQSGPGGTVPSGMSSPQYAQYYQVPPQPSPQNPAFTQAPGYGPYQESPPQKPGSSMMPGSAGADYPMMAPSLSNLVPISSYQNIPVSSSGAYNAMQNLNYSYQPASAVPVHTLSQEHGVPGHNSSIVTSQQGMNVHPMVYSAMQGKPQTTPYGNQNMTGFHQQVPGANFQPYATTQTANPGGVAMQTTGPYQQGGTGAKDGSVSSQMLNPGIASAPRPVPAQQYAPYGQQQLVYSPQVPPASAALGADQFNQNTQSDGTKQAQVQEKKSAADKELSDKMQAIVLKNMQKQGSASDSNAEAATIASGGHSTKQSHVNQQSMAESSNQIRMTPAPLRPPSEQQIYPNQPNYQCANAGGIQQPQTMQVYLMPRSNQVPAGASYRTYSQFITQPQTPHVMGPGMHFVYLNPAVGGVVGVDGTASATVPVNPQILHSQPEHHMHRPPAGTQAPITNTNNNNIAIKALSEDVSTPRNVEARKDPTDRKKQSTTQCAEHQTSATLLCKDGVDASLKAGADSEMNGPLASASNIQGAEDKRPAVIKSGVLKNNSHSNTVSSYVPASGGGVTSYSTANATTAGLNHKTSANDHPQQHTSSHFLTQSNQPLLLGNNLPRDYMLAGVSPNNPVSFNATMVPQYSMYPGMSAVPTVPPYVKYYLPSNATCGQKMQDVKMYQGASSPSNMIAVQLPNQNQIQFVPTALPPPSPIYYAPHNHMTNEYHTAMQSSRVSYMGADNKPQVLEGQETFDQAIEIKADECPESVEDTPPTGEAEISDVVRTPACTRTQQLETSSGN